jgi:soluble lytic murein transglycosylase-like protein
MNLPQSLAVSEPRAQATEDLMTATRTLWLALTLLAAVWASADAATPSPPARDYLALRQSLRATPFTPEVAAGARGTWRGKVFELVGRVMGRTNSSVTSRERPLTFMLHVPGTREMAMVDATKEDPLIAVDQVVHVLAQFPDAGGPTEHFQLKAIIGESDLPADQQTYAQAAAAEAVQPVTQRASATLVAPEANTKTRKLGTSGSEPEAPTPPEQRPVPARPGTEPPRQLAASVPEQSVASWKNWVSGINPRLSDAELEIIVRSVLYYSALYGVDRRLSFAMIKCESDFDPKCLSHAGAMGLTQLMPDTAKGLGCSNPWDLEQNIRGGLQELSQHLRAYAGRSNYEQCVLGLACYNAGPGAVKRAGGVPNYPETIRYVKKVTDLFYQLFKGAMP